MISQASTTIITLIALGKYMESVEKRPATTVIEALAVMLLPHARIYNDITKTSCATLVLFNILAVCAAVVVVTGENIPADGIIVYG